MLTDSEPRGHNFKITQLFYKSKFSHTHIVETSRSRNTTTISLHPGTKVDNLKLNSSTDLNRDYSSFGLGGSSSSSDLNLSSSDLGLLRHKDSSINVDDAALELNQSGDGDAILGFKGDYDADAEKKFKTPKERSRDYRARKKLRAGLGVDSLESDNLNRDIGAEQKIKTPKERSRDYRARKKQKAGPGAGSLEVPKARPKAEPKVKPKAKPKVKPKAKPRAVVVRKTKK